MRYKDLTQQRLENISNMLKVLSFQVNRNEPHYEIQSQMDKINEEIEKIKGNLLLETQE